MKMIRFAILVGLTACLACAACSEYSNKTKGDLNGDGHLTQADITLLSGWLASGSSNSDGDINGDGKIDTQDLEALRELVCQSNGGSMDAPLAGKCCLTNSDDSICCDSNFDGDFNDCIVNKDCTENADCDVLNCPAFCTSEGKCRCQGMCDSDDDCYALNCPAFCNGNGECECKIACDTDADCGFIEHCPSICGDEGHCVCQGECLGEGERFMGDDKQCCAGLTAIDDAEYNAGECYFFDCACFVCAYCGNSECGPGENPCNCPADCGECLPGDARPYACPDGSNVSWCECDEHHTWQCIDSPENQCATQCHAAGDRFTDFEGKQTCCAGLTKADDCIPDVVNGEVSCACPDCPCFVCVDCGDGVCGQAENSCNCPDDCPQPECVEGATLPCNCMNNLAEEPACWMCDANGSWTPIEYEADPCNCLYSAGCREGYVCEADTGLCQLDCRLVNCDPGTNCVDYCGDSQVCHPDTGLCVTDCRLIAGPLSCPQGQRCDDQSGICVADCLGEGEKFEDFDQEGKCCAGLVAVPDYLPEDGQCVGPNCPCFVCTRCGTDEGVCSLGENRCNCPEDCVGAGNCQADQCENVARSYAISGDCPGVPSSGDPLVMYDIFQEGCSLVFKDLLGTLLGSSGCIDDHVIFTARRCSGAVTITGASRTMYFSCPFPNADGSNDSCTVYLDDLID
jgi:hypothetical protein